MASPPPEMPPSPPLPAGFLGRPVAHRGLHDARLRRPENAHPAVAAAIGAGYGIELDLRLSADGVAMVFHDAGLARMTGHAGTLEATPAAALSRMSLAGTRHAIPRLAAVLAQIAGRVPLLLELKQKRDDLGPVAGALEAAVARDLAAYPGPVALMAFNAHSLARCALAAPARPRILATGRFDAAQWPEATAAACRAARSLDHLGHVAPAALSHEAADLDRADLAALRRAGLPVLTWTIRSRDAAATAYGRADQITFEGFRPALAAARPGPSA